MSRPLTLRSAWAHNAVEPLLVPSRPGGCAGNDAAGVEGPLDPRADSTYWPGARPENRKRPSLDDDRRMLVASGTERPPGAVARLMFTCRFAGARPSGVTTAPSTLAVCTSCSAKLTPSRSSPAATV